MGDITPAELDNANRTWSYDRHLRPYFLLLGRLGREGLESRQNFPRRIQLSKGIHKLLEDMRSDQRDGNERFALMGYRDDSPDIILPSSLVVGEKDHIRGKSIREERDRFKKEEQISSLVGDLHSHPRGLYYPSWWVEDFQSVGERLQSVVDITGAIDNASFSPADMYCLVSQLSTFPEFIPVMGVAEGRKNIFSFATR